MRIVILAENTTVKKELGFQHGLSLYVETPHHKLLFDVGADDLFLKNAEKLGIDIRLIDLLVISHGHYDHGGGLMAFLQVNQTAKIYIHRKAFIEHLFPLENNTYRDIGISKETMQHPQVILVDANFKIDEELMLLSQIKQADLVAKSNLSLLKKEKQEIEVDDFLHEQSLLIQSKGKRVLITGCSHRGIVNIVEQVIKDFPGKLDVVIGGFHLYNPGNQIAEPAAFVQKVGKRLQKIETTYYTGHCTGREAYEYLKKMLKDRLFYASTGEEIIVK